jgi:predicted  nucleic acid-binding Zn-ribbon protein
MDDIERFASCGNADCGWVFADFEEANKLPRQQCPKCGSTARHFSVHVSDSITIHEKLAVKAKRAGAKKPFLEGVSGEDLHRDSATCSKIERVIDRENDRYRERIVDAEGNIVREVDEPLSEHRGRGSAKPRTGGEP